MAIILSNQWFTFQTTFSQIGLTTSDAPTPLAPCKSTSLSLPLCFSQKTKKTQVYWYKHTRRRGLDQRGDALQIGLAAYQLVKTLLFFLLPVAGRKTWTNQEKCVSHQGRKKESKQKLETNKNIRSLSPN